MEIIIKLRIKRVLSPPPGNGNSDPSFYTPRNLSKRKYSIKIDNNIMMMLKRHGGRVSFDSVHCMAQLSVQVPSIFNSINWIISFKLTSIDFIVRPSQFDILL